jgi:hypothetical protein
LVPDVTQFSTQRSWLVPEAARHDVAVALIAAVIVASAALALAVWGVPGLAAAWPVLAVLAGVLSLVLLVAYWETQLVLGVVIDVTMVALAVLQPDWLQDFLT